MGVRSDRVIKSGNVRNWALLLLLHRLKMPAVQFFFFQVFEEAFHYGIVIRVSFSRKGLNHAERINHFTEIRESKSETPNPCGTKFLLNRLLAERHPIRYLDLHLWICNTPVQDRASFYESQGVYPFSHKSPESFA